jgi:antitoxin CcdA
MNDAHRKGVRESGAAYSPKAPRKVAVNLRLDAGLIAEAKAAGLNLSATLSAALTERLKDQRAKQWADEHRAFIEWQNKDIEENGLWSDGLRLF